MGAMPSLDLGKPKKKSGLASSVVAGQFIGNVKKMNTSGRSNFAASVNLGMLGNDVSLGGSLTTNPTAILGGLADDANLPNELEDVNDGWHNYTYCELCDRTFSKFKGISRHHCRKCLKSVCQQCSSNTRKLSKQDDTKYRVCDFCDTQLSNYKLETNQN